MRPLPPGSTLFPYTTLFRSSRSAVVSASGGPLPASMSALLTHSRRSEEHTSELQSRRELVCRLLLEKKKYRDSCACLPVFADPRQRKARQSVVYLESVAGKVRSHSSQSFSLNAPPTTGIYPLSLHDALPIFALGRRERFRRPFASVDVRSLDPLA